MGFWESTWKLLNTLESMTRSYHSWVLADCLTHSDICTSIFSVVQFTLVIMESTRCPSTEERMGKMRYTQRHTYTAMVSAISFVVYSKMDSNGNCYTKKLSLSEKDKHRMLVLMVNPQFYKHT